MGLRIRSRATRGCGRTRAAGRWRSAAMQIAFTPLDVAGGVLCICGVLCLTIFLAVRLPLSNSRRDRGCTAVRCVSAIGLPSENVLVVWAASAGCTHDSQCGGGGMLGRVPPSRGDPTYHTSLGSRLSDAGSTAVRRVRCLCDVVFGLYLVFSQSATPRLTSLRAHSPTHTHRRAYTLIPIDLFLVSFSRWSRCSSPPLHPPSTLPSPFPCPSLYQLPRNRD